MSTPPVTGPRRGRTPRRRGGRKGWWSRAFVVERLASNWSLYSQPLLALTSKAPRRRGRVRRSWRDRRRASRTSCRRRTAPTASASHSRAVSARMPPVGQKRTSPKRRRQRLERGDSARCLGREEFEAVEPEVEPAHDVGRGRDAGQDTESPVSRAASASGLVRPGETMNRLPASIACASCASLSTVPAPTIAPGTWLIARIASSAPGVRSVTSSTGSPAGDERLGQLGPVQLRRRAPAPG